MYMFDIQFKLLHVKVATNDRLCKMEILDSEECEYCQEIESVNHEFLLCERAQQFWRDITLWLQYLGYYNFRLGN